MIQANQEENAASTVTEPSRGRSKDAELREHNGLGLFSSGFVGVRPDGSPPARIYYPPQYRNYGGYNPSLEGIDNFGRKTGGVVCEAAGYGMEGIGAAFNAVPPEMRAVVGYLGEQYLTSPQAGIVYAFSPKLGLAAYGLGTAAAFNDQILSSAGDFLEEAGRQLQEAGRRMCD